MDAQILAPYRIVINTLSPLHIGTGDKLSRLDYLLDQASLVVLDDRKVLEWVAADLSGRRASDFTRNVEKGGSIRHFLDLHPKDTADLEAYRIDNHTVSRKVEDIHPFIKNSINQPYLPGSSLKGALRSSLLRGITLEQQELRQQINDLVYQAATTANRKGRKGSSGSEELEAKTFIKADVARSKYSNFDLNRVLLIGDSLPKKQRYLELVEVKILSARRDTLSTKDFSIYVESMRASSKEFPVSFQLPATWQTHLLLGQGAAASLKLDQIRKYMVFLPEYCRSASLHLLNQEIKFYGSFGHPLAHWFEEKRDLLNQLREDYFILPIGWGSGYDAKTITDLLEIATFQSVADVWENTKGIGRAGNRRDSPWLGPELSPKSRRLVIRADGSYEPLGWLLMVFRPEKDGGDDWYKSQRKIDQKHKPVFIDEIETTPQTKPPDSGQTSPPKPVEPDEPKMPKKKLASAEKPALVVSFTELPKKGQYFAGVIDVVDDDGTVYINLPGLSPEDQAIGIIRPADRDSWVRFKEGSIMECEIIGVEEEEGNSGFFLVYCRQYLV